MLNPDTTKEVKGAPVKGFPWSEVSLPWPHAAAVILPAALKFPFWSLASLTAFSVPLQQLASPGAYLLKQVSQANPDVSPQVSRRHSHRVTGGDACACTPTPLALGQCRQASAVKPCILGSRSRCPPSELSLRRWQGG